MALKYASMMNMSKNDLLALCTDLEMHYPATYTPNKFQMCLDIPAHISKFKQDLEDVSANIGYMGIGN